MGTIESAPDDFMLFSKSFQDIPLQSLAGRMKEMGIDSLDLTVREDGHVKPSEVEDGLPRMCEHLSKFGVSVGMISTTLTSASDPFARSILKTAVRCGIGYYKIGYYPYEGFGSLTRQLRSVKAQVRGLAELNGEIGIHGGFHNHSHHAIGASLWDVAEVLEGTAPEAMGLYLDPTHALIEGGAGAWRMGIDLLSDRITMLAAKDFRWIEGTHKHGGGRRNSTEFCPLDEGNVPWPEVIEILHQVGFNGPVSFHADYRGLVSFEDLSAEDSLGVAQRDFEIFRTWLAAEYADT